MAMSNADVGEQPSPEELLRAQAHIWNHVFHYVNSMSLKCAVELNIPDAIHRHGEPMTLCQLADALAIAKSKSNALHRLMRVLVHSKFFSKVKREGEEEEEAYSLTTASRLLLGDAETSMAGFVMAAFDPVIFDPWHVMSGWFRNGDASPFVTKHGRTMWEHAGGEEGFNEMFNEVLANDSKLVSRVLVRECRKVFEGLEKLVDVAGGTGSTARGIADAFPGLECVVLDLPHVVAGLDGCDNLSFVGGDMFEFIPCADAVLLKWILHDWSDENCIKLLKKCLAAISQRKGHIGKVIIIEIIVEDQKENHKATETQLFWDMQMMVEVAGKERTEKEWAEIFSAAGFNSYKITPLLGMRSVIEVFP